MADDGPVTKADLNTIKAEVTALADLIKNELAHIKEDVAANTVWRQEFMKEDGPWRSVDRRVSALEYLARSIKVIGVTLTPIALWAIMEIIEATVAWIQGGP